MRCEMPLLEEGGSLLSAAVLIPANYPRSVHHYDCRAGEDGVGVFQWSREVEDMHLLIDTRL